MEEERARGLWDKPAGRREPDKPGGGRSEGERIPPPHTHQMALFPMLLLPAMTPHPSNPFIPASAWLEPISGPDLLAELQQLADDVEDGVRAVGFRP